MAGALQFRSLNPNVYHINQEEEALKKVKR